MLIMLVKFIFTDLMMNMCIFLEFNFVIYSDIRFPEIMILWCGNCVKRNCCLMMNTGIFMELIQ